MKQHKKTKPDHWDSSLYDDRHSFVWKAGGDLLELLAPSAGERILDLGCGTGHLTAQIAGAGVDVMGLDSSTSMVAQARQNYPKMKFTLADARAFTFDEPFDAVFSNAALHWIPDAEAVIARVHTILKPQGRFVLEMGARGNIDRIRTALETLLREFGLEPVSPWFYPSLAEYSRLLEKTGFEVRYAATIPRWTKLEHPEKGLREWLEMFAQPYLQLVDASRVEDLFRQMEVRLRDHLFCDGHWWADYRRLRVVAVTSSSAPMLLQPGI